MKISLPEELTCHINKFMSTPSSDAISKACIPVSTRDWDDYEKCLLLLKSYKLHCYSQNIRPIVLPKNWNAIDYELFLFVLPYSANW